MTINDESTLVVQTCPTCGVRHALPLSMNNEARNNRGPLGRQIYCPNGHTWHYTGKTATELERERSESLQRRLEQASRVREQYERSLRSTKGQVTKLRKRLGLEERG